MGNLCEVVIVKLEGPSGATGTSDSEKPGVLNYIPGPRNLWPWPMNDCLRFKLLSSTTI